MFLETPSHLLQAALADADPEARQVGIIFLDERDVRRVDQALDGRDLFVRNDQVEKIAAGTSRSTKRSTGC